MRKDCSPVHTTLRGSDSSRGGERRAACPECRKVMLYLSVQELNTIVLIKKGAGGTGLAVLEMAQFRGTPYGLPGLLAPLQGQKRAKSGPPRGLRARLGRPCAAALGGGEVSRLCRPHPTTAASANPPQEPAAAVLPPDQASCC